MSDEWGKIDGFTPKMALMSDNGMTVALYLTKPPQFGNNPQEAHVLRLSLPPSDIYQVYINRC